MAKKMTREELGVKHKDSIVIKGFIKYSRFLTKVEGEEFEKANQLRLSKGQIVESRPYYSITLVNPEVTRGQNTPLARYHEDRFYESNGETRLALTSKAAIPIRAYQLDANGQANAVTLDSELAQGQEVYLLIDAFKSKGFANLGSTFSAVLLPLGEIKYYKAGIGADLAGFGVLPGQTPNGPTAQTTQIPDVATANPYVAQPAQPFTPNTAPTQYAQPQVPPVAPNQYAQPQVPPAQFDPFAVQ